MSGVLCSFVGGTYASGFNTNTPIGTSIEGGFYGGLINDGGTTYALIVAPKSSGDSASIQYKTTDSLQSGLSSRTDGPANTEAVNDSNHPASQFVSGLSIGGFTDWYIPALDELEVLYYNLKPTTTNNVTNHGTNTNAVPPRNSDYTTGNPAQTSVSAFQSGNSEAFSVNRSYWSSSDINSNGTLEIIFFGDGDLFNTTPDGQRDVRAIRRVEAG